MKVEYEEKGKGAGRAYHPIRNDKLHHIHSRFTPTNQKAKQFVVEDSTQPVVKTEEAAEL